LDKHTAYFNILAALPQPGCVICRLGHDVEISHIKDMLYSKTTSIKTRAEMRDARGFCMAHAQQLDQIGHALDLSIIYQDILITLRQALKEPSPRKAAGRRGKAQLSSALGAQRECPVCTYREEMIEVYVETFLDHLVEAPFAAKVEAAAPLCLVHLSQVIENLSTAEQFRTLRDIQLAHWEGLIAELGEFVRKNDHRYQSEPVGREGTAWLRAIDAVAGTRKF
jgi:hypothetical protein